MSFHLKRVDFLNKHWGELSSQDDSIYISDAAGDRVLKFSGDGDGIVVSWAVKHSNGCTVGSGKTLFLGSVVRVCPEDLVILKYPSRSQYPKDRIMRIMNPPFTRQTIFNMYFHGILYKEATKPI